MSFFKKKKEPTSSLLTAKISNTFDFSSQVNPNVRNDKNFKSIFSYQSFDIEKDENLPNEKTNRAVTLMFGFLLVLFFPVLGWFSLKIITKNRKLAVYRCGKLLSIKNPGVAVTIPFIDSCQYISTEITECCIKKASCTTSDQGIVEIDCLVKYRIVDPMYFLQSVTDWQEHIINEMRIVLVSCVKYFRWSDFRNNRVIYDIQTEMMKVLPANKSTKGLEVKEILLENISQGPEPESPIDILKKINFKELGRHLSSMTPMFINPAFPKDKIPPPPPNTMFDVSDDSQDPNSSSTGEETSSTGHNKAVDEFFEKLELIKNLALNSAAANQNKAAGAGMSFPFNMAGTAASNSAATHDDDRADDTCDVNSPLLEQQTPQQKQAQQLQQIFGELVKNFIKRHLNWTNAQQILRDGNLSSIFINDESGDSSSSGLSKASKLTEMALQLKQISYQFNINTPVQFRIDKYFHQPCYFYFDPVHVVLKNGQADNAEMQILLD